MQEADIHTKVQSERSSPNFGNTMLAAVPSKVFNEDCVKSLKRFPDKYFDVAIVDPPYGIGRSGQTETFTKLKKHKRKYFEDNNWDGEPPTLEYWRELVRVSKNQIVWGANYFTEYLPPSMGWIFWDKGQDLSMSDGELAYTSFNRALRRVKINRGQLIAEGGTIHPTQKPIKLYDWLLINYCVEANLILDTHVGSGSSRIACYKAGKQFVGFEINKDYYEKQEKRFNDFVSQLRMF
jgi:site-specific DNA-methyltransferase (adenine-specific)